MLKRLKKLDSRLESYINQMDRTLQAPVNRVITFEVFRQNGAHSAHTAKPQTVREVEMDTNDAQETTVNTSYAVKSDSAWDYC